MLSGPPPWRHQYLSPPVAPDTYVYTYTYVYIYMYIYIYIYTHVYNYIYIYIYIYNMVHRPAKGESHKGYLQVAQR